MTPDRNNVRVLLKELGIGDFNASLVVKKMFIAPATTDPKMPAVMILVAAIQDNLNAIGAGLERTGYLDVPTAKVLTAVVGPGWERMMWCDVVAHVLAARKSGGQIGTPMAHAYTLPPAPDVSFAGIPILDSLPDVPGGLVTYGVAAFLIYRHLKKKKR